MNRSLTPLLATIALLASVLGAVPVLSQETPSEDPTQPAPVEPASENMDEPSSGTMTESTQPTITEPAQPTMTEPDVINSVSYKCDAGKAFQAEYLSNNTVRATFGSKVLVLPQVPSGSGVQYSEGNVTLRGKGDEAFVEVDNKILFKNCVAQVPIQKEPVEGLW